MTRLRLRLPADGRVRLAAAAVFLLFVLVLPQLATLQEHVKHETAPYKYPRIVEFAAELPKTASGKIRRAALRGQLPSSP